MGGRGEEEPALSAGNIEETSLPREATVSPGLEQQHSPSANWWTSNLVDTIQELNVTSPSA